MLQATRGLSLLALIWCHAILLARAQVGLTALRVDNLVPSASPVESFFSWTINSTSEYRVSQESYQISVSHSGGEEIWNSGVTSSNRTQLIQYTGPQLLPHIHYTWSVKVSTSAGPAVASSELLANSSKYDVWVGKRDEPLPSELDKHFESNSSWIWTTDGSLDDALPGNRGFRYTFDVPPEETALSALIKVTVDDRFSIYVNGDQIDTHSGWQKGQQYDIRFPPDTTRIVFAINATNNRGPAGVITAIQVILSNGESHFLQSNESWRSTDTIPDGFESSNFNDTSWPNAMVLGRFGSGHWMRNITFAQKPEVQPIPPYPKPTLHTTTTALPAPSTSSGPANQSALPPNPSLTKTGVDTNIGAILGGVFGGVIILILLALVGYLWHSQKKKNRPHTGQPHLFDLEYAHRGSFLSMAESLPSSISSLRHLPPTSISPSMSVSAVAERNRKK